MQKNTKGFPDKKALSLEIKNQLNQSLGYLKELWGEKKFNNKVDDAVKVFTKGFKKLDHAKEPVKIEEPVSAKPKAVADKKAVRKEDVKKEDTKKEIKAAPKKAIAPKKQPAQKAAGKSPAKSAK